MQNYQQCFWPFSISYLHISFNFLFHGSLMMLTTSCPSFFFRSSDKEISFSSVHRLFSMPFSHLFHRLYASVLYSVYPPFFHLILKLHSTKPKQKARKPCIWPDGCSVYPLAKPISSNLANRVRRANQSHSGNTPIAGNDCDQLSWLYLMSLEQSQALLSVYNINTPQATKT